MTKDEQAQEKDLFCLFSFILAYFYYFQLNKPKK